MKKLGIVTVIGVATLILFALTRNAEAWQQLADAYLAYHNSLAKAVKTDDLPRWISLGLFLVFLGSIALIVAFSVFSKRRRIAKLRQDREQDERHLVPTKHHRIFSLAPREVKVDVESKMLDRADGEHEKILEWICKATHPILYLAGQSGTGKSSIVHAFVVPSLKRGTNPTNPLVIVIRAFGDLSATLRSEFGRLSDLWDHPPELTELTNREILELVKLRLRSIDRRLVLIIDQFDEVLAGMTVEQLRDHATIKLLRSLCDEPIKELTCVLVTRIEYEKVFGLLGLPARQSRENWHDVPPFTIEEGITYILAGLEKLHPGRSDNPAIADALARQAAELEHMDLTVTPIALNMIGVMYESDPVLGAQLGKTNIKALEGALQAFVRSRTDSGVLRYQSLVILDQLVTATGTRTQPHTTSSIARSIAIDEGTIETVMLMLERRGIVRTIGASWELSHEFLAPVIRRVVDQSNKRFIKYLQVLKPISVAVTMLAVLVVPFAFQQWRLMRAFSNCAIFDPTEKHVRITGEFSVDAAKSLIWISDVEKLIITETSHFNPHAARELSKSMSSLKKLTSVHMGRGAATDLLLIEMSRPELGRKSVNQFTMFDSRCTDSAVAALTSPDTALAELTYLDLSGNDITEAAIMMLARPESGLKKLKTLSFNPVDVTDLNMKAICAPRSPLSGLETLSLYSSRLTEVGLSELTNPSSALSSLQYLDISGVRVTSAMIEVLTAPGGGLESLQQLTISSSSLSESDLKKFARPSSGLSSLNTLDLSQAKITDEVLKEFAREDSALKNLQSLSFNAYGTTDLSAKLLAAEDSGLMNLTSLGLKGPEAADLWRFDTRTPERDLPRLAIEHAIGKTVTDEGIRALTHPKSGLHQLKTLYLTGITLTDAGVSYLADTRSRLSGVRNLDISGNDVTNAGVMVLARPGIPVGSINSLGLFRTLVDDGLLGSLSITPGSLTNLTSIDARETRVTDSASQLLEQARTGLKIHWGGIPREPE